MMKTVFLLLLGLVFLCKGLKGDENENEDAIVLDEDDDEIPNELDEIKYKATAEAEDPGHCRMPNCRGLKRKRRCRCRRRRCICRCFRMFDCHTPKCKRNCRRQCRRRYRCR